MLLTLTKSETYETKKEIEIEVPAIFKDSTDWLHLVTARAIIVVSQYGVSIYKKGTSIYEVRVQEILQMERTDDINAFMKLYQNVTGSIIISINANKMKFINKIVNGK